MVSELGVHLHACYTLVLHLADPLGQVLYVEGPQVVDDVDGVDGNVLQPQDLYFGHSLDHLRSFPLETPKKSVARWEHPFEDDPYRLIDALHAPLPQLRGLGLDVALHLLRLDRRSRQFLFSYLSTDVLVS